MVTGIKFEFTHRSDLDLAEAMIDDVARNKFANGEINVLAGDKVIGTAGKLTKETVNAILKGTVLSLVAEFNPNEELDLIKQVSAINAVVNPMGRSGELFSLVR